MYKMDESLHLNENTDPFLAARSEGSREFITQHRVTGLI